MYNLTELVVLKPMPAYNRTGFFHPQELEGLAVDMLVFDEYMKYEQRQKAGNRERKGSFWHIKYCART